MSGLWVFKSPMQRLTENGGATGPKKVLVYKPTREAICFHEELEPKLKEQEGGSASNGATTLQFRRPRAGDPDLISLPKDFAQLNFTHMFNVVMQNPSSFEAVDADGRLNCMHARRAIMSRLGIGTVQTPDL